jgi:hypothetical protein
LDALSPSFIDNLVTEQIEKVRDEHAWDARQRIVSTLRDEIGGLVFQATDEDGVQKMIDEQNGEDDES